MPNKRRTLLLEENKLNDKKKNQESKEILIKPKRFREKDACNYLEKLISSNEFSYALEYLLESLPELPGTKINRQEKLNYLLFMSRLIQTGKGAKYGYEKLIRKVLSLEENIKGIDISTEGTFVEFGCGAHDPIALSTFFYANGFNRCLAIDLLEPRNAVYSALSMYDILANMIMLPQKYLRKGSNLKDFRQKLKKFDIEKFESGNFYGGFKSLTDHSKLSYKACDIVDTGLRKNEVSFLTSFAVFEHVMEIKEVCQYLYDVMKPGGIGFHFVDLADHRSYGKKGFNEFSFLTELEAPPNINRLRKTEIISEFVEAGFEIINQKGVQVKIPDETRNKLLPKWADMSEEDQTTTKLYLTLKKPI